MFKLALICCQYVFLCRAYSSISCLIWSALPATLKVVVISPAQDSNFRDICLEQADKSSSWQEKCLNKSVCFLVIDYCLIQHLLLAVNHQQFLCDFVGIVCEQRLGFGTSRKYFLNFHFHQFNIFQHVFQH